MREPGGLQGSDSVASDLANTRNAAHAMRTLQRSCQDTGLTLPVEINITDHPDCENMPWLSLSSWIQFLVKEDKLGRLYGDLPADDVGPVFKQLWMTYRKLEPDLEVYKHFDNGSIDMERTIMMTSHQDEGRGIFALIDIY